MTEPLETKSEEENRLKTHHNLRWIFISITFGAALIATLIVQPWNLPVNAQTILNEAFAAMDDVNSFRATYSDLSSGYNAFQTDIELMSTTRYHAICSRVYFTTELIVFDGKKYVKGDTTPINEIIQSVEFTLAKLDENYRSLLIDTLSKLEKLPTQVIEGETCVHYQGKSDPDRLDEVDISGISGSDITINYEDLIRIISNVRVSVYEYEFWIGKTDDRLRQIKSVYQGWNSSYTGPITVTFSSSPSIPLQLQRPLTSLICTFYDFNEPIMIEAPLDVDGQLLPGWRIEE